MYVCRSRLFRFVVERKCQVEFCMARCLADMLSTVIVNMSIRFCQFSVWQICSLIPSFSICNRGRCSSRGLQVRCWAFMLVDSYLSICGRQRCCGTSDIRSCALHRVGHIRFALRRCRRSCFARSRFMFLRCRVVHANVGTGARTGTSSHAFGSRWRKGCDRRGRSVAMGHTSGVSGASGVSDCVGSIGLDKRVVAS